MASEQANSDDRSDEAHEPRECMPCRGTGELISNLGGTPSKVTCPWCGGGGVRVPGVDAQARWGAESAEPAGAAEPADAAAPEGSGERAPAE